MSQIKAKQVKLNAPGDILVAGTNGTGTVVSATGKEDKVLRVVNGAPDWSQNDNIKSANTNNKVVATDGSGVAVSVQNSDDSASVELMKFKSGSVADEAVEVSSEAGKVAFKATGTATDVDLVLTPQGSGDVIIGSTGGGVIQSDTNEDLALKGGVGAGNLYLNGGGTGKVYYADDASDTSKEVATIGAVTTAIAASTPYQTRVEYTGADTFDLGVNTIAGSIIAHINGVAVKENNFSYNGSTHIVTFDSGNIGYTLDSNDEILFTYEKMPA